jgi:hypothetical protein
VMVLWVHDVSDIFVDVLKLANYLKLEGKKRFYLSEIAWAICLGAWGYWRLFKYPFTVMYSGFFVSVKVFAERYIPKEVPAYAQLGTLLIVLQVLHLYWFYLLLMVGYRTCVEGGREASRQEYEGDSDDGDDVQQNDGRDDASEDEDVAELLRQLSDTPSSKAAITLNGKQKGW